MAGSDSKRIAKNTMMLYFRMILSMVISLYTSRVVLDVLGVSDFGVYGVVGGVIGMFSFLNASMSGATSRFITYELGRGDMSQLRKTFSSAVIIHIGIAILVLILCETVGLWFLQNKLVIPDDARSAAMWVYQLAIVSALIQITQVPYTACIISHERMQVYAYVEILNVVLKLAVVFLLQAIPGSKLVIYSILLVVASMIVAGVYRIYAVRNFTECKGFKPCWDKKIIRPMLSFSGWDVYGNLCGMAFYQGTTFLLNIFFGVVTNAANSIANTVAGVLVGLSNNVTAAYRPHIIKQYAARNFAAMTQALRQGVLAVMILSALVSIPAYIEMPFIIRLWLGQEPEYTVVFCRLLIIFFMLGQINAYMIMAIHATGRIKWLSFLGGTVYLLTVPVIWACFKMGMTPMWAYIVHVGGRVLILILDFILMHRLLPELKSRLFFWTVLKSSVAIVAVFMLCELVPRGAFGPWGHLFVTAALSSVSLLIVSYTLLLDRAQRSQVNIYLSNFKNRICRKSA